MPKPITLDMLNQMSPDQLKTLKQNAMGRDTPASRDVLELLAQDDVASRFIKPPAKSSVAKAAAKPSARRTLAGSKAKSTVTAAAPKAVQAKHGRQS